MKNSIFLIIASFLVLTSCEMVDSIGGNNNDNRVELFPVQIEGEWGYINKDGKVVIEPSFQNASFFFDGLAAVRESNRRKYINKNGDVVIEGNFSSTGNFSEGKAAVRFDGRWGYINKSGSFIINPKYRSAHSFSDGRAFVRSIDFRDYFYINGEGIKLENPNLPDDFDFIDENEFRDGLALVRNDDNFGYINRDGNTVIDFKYSEARPFSEKLAAVKISDKWGYIDRSENVKLSPQYISAGDFGNGLAPARRNSNQFGYIDKNGSFVIDEQFDEALPFREDRAAVFLNGKWTFIDKSGNQIRSPEFDEVEPFINGLAMVKIRIPNEMDDDFTEKTGYIDKNGRFVWFPTN